MTEVNDSSADPPGDGPGNAAGEAARPGPARGRPRVAVIRTIVTTPQQRKEAIDALAALIVTHAGNGPGASSRSGSTRKAA